jgi:hypothetical protein
MSKLAMSQRDANLKARIERWRDAFRDNTTGINKTMHDLVWYYAAFRTALKIVNLSTEKGDQGPPLNEMMFDLVQTGYWSSLLIGVRRLLDASSALNGKRGVYSLRSVIRDIEASRSLITRRVYVEWVCGAQYDVDRLRKQHWETLHAADGKAVWGDPELPKSEWSHRYFDRLSGVSPDERAPDDLIDARTFTLLEARLARLDSIAEYVSSHVVHAGNVESRQGRGIGDFNIEDARLALRELKQIGDLVGIWFAGASSAGLATYIGDQFLGLDSPMVARAEITTLEQQWHEIEQDVAGWSTSLGEL